MRAVGVHDRFLKSELNNNSGIFRSRLTIVNLQMDYGRFWVFLRNAVERWVRINLCRVDRIVVGVCSLVSPVIEILVIGLNRAQAEILTHIYKISSLRTSLSLAMMKRGGRPPK